MIDNIKFLMHANGEMAERVRNFNWAETSLRDIDDWPVTLQSSLGICLNSNFPIALYWGEDLILIYNDAWSSIPGNKHPWALGRPARAVWPDIWNEIEPQFKKAFGGEPGGSKDALLPMQRHGYTEECYFDFTFTPVFGAEGKVEGVFNAVIETTYRVINERRTQFLQNFSNHIVKARSFEELFRHATDEVKTNRKDVPFALFYWLSAEKKAELIGATESTGDVRLKNSWPVEELQTTLQSMRIEDPGSYLATVPAGAWPEMPKEAFVVPLRGSDGAMTGFVVFGVSARRTLDKEYQSFFESICGSLSIVLNALIARITSQIKLIRTRREVENNLRNAIMQSPIATALLRGPSFIVEMVNDLGLEVWGRSYEQVINKPIAVALPEVEPQGFVKLLEQVYNTGVPFKGNEVPIELTRFGKSQTVYCNFIYTPLRSSQNHTIGIIAIGIDVSEQVYARKAVEEAKASLNNAVELGELGTWEIDLGTTYTTYSSRVAEWWGLPEPGANLEDIINCMHIDDQDHVTRAVQYAIDVSGSYQTEYRLIHAITKQERFIQAIGNVTYDQNNVPVKLSGIVRDVTLQRMTEQELERQVQIRTKQLEEVNADLQRSNNDLMQFAYAASHDLQEPLRKIQTFSDMAQAKLSDTGYVKSYLEKIDNSASRMATLIKDVLSYSQVSREPKQKEEVDLNTILQNVKNDFELLMEQKNAIIESSALPVIRGSRLQFHQLFSNLIGNSLKFSEDAPRIHISHELLNGNEIAHENIDATKMYHVLNFKDNGIGFDRAHEEQIFGLFKRLHNKRDYSGTGIGLALCRKIAENHHGVIKAFSVKGEGATFKVYLPLET